MLEYTKTEIKKKIKKKKKLNQQGTFQKGTPETTSKKTNSLDLKINFTNWFIGFVESSEQCLIVNRRYLRFELNVNIKYDYIIYYIKQKLELGDIRKLRYLDTIIVEISIQENIEHLISFIKIINGNFRCPYKEELFKVFYKKLETKLKKLEKLHLLPVYISELKNPSLNDSWLLGYCENKMLLYARWHKSKKLALGKELYIIIIFWNLNEKLLIKIKELLNSKAKIESKIKYNLPFFKLIIEDINEKNIIKNYLLEFTLKNKRKRNIFKIWKHLLELDDKYKKNNDIILLDEMEFNLNLLKKYYLEDEALYKV